MSKGLISIRDDEMKSYKDDILNVFGDPDKFGLAVLLAFFHNSPVTVNYAFSKQRDFGMDVPKESITHVFDDWVTKSYAVKVKADSYEATPKMYTALKKDGVTMESLTKLANAYIKG